VISFRIFLFAFICFYNLFVLYLHWLTKINPENKSRPPLIGRLFRDKRII